MDIQVLRSYFPLFQTAAGLTVRLGAEGIFLMYETEPWAEALKEKAAFIAGDGVRRDD